MSFSKQNALTAVRFFERILKHTADEWYGKPFKLAPWQREFIEQLFGQLNDDGTKVINFCYLEVPKKSGKTELCAGLALMALLLDQNPGCQVYGAAASQKQAGNVYRAACKMVEQHQVLRDELRILRGTNRIIKKRDPESFYAAIAADGDLTDGVNPSFTICDELHRWKERKHLENFDVLSLGGITRRESCTVCITTAGVQDDSPLAWRMHEKTERIQQGITSDPQFYGRIYTAPRSMDWTKPETWLKANPSLVDNGGFLPIQKYHDLFKATETDLEAQIAFQRYMLNWWGQKGERCIPMTMWEKCHGDWTAEGLGEKSPEDQIRPLSPALAKYFIERPCWAGVDLSMTTDMTAVAFLFPTPDGFFDVLPFFWIPEDAVSKRQLQDGMPYRDWANKGFLELSPGSVIDYRDVKARLEWGARMFDLKEICFDPHEARQISVPLIEAGFECVEVRQGFNTSEANKKLLELIASGKLRHGGHPILKWNASCLSSKEHNDQLMFVKPERQKDRARIDGITATVDALFRAMLYDFNAGSVYETRGVQSV